MKRFSLVIVAMILAVTMLVPEGASAASKKDVPTAGECMMKYAKKYTGSRYSLGGTYLKDLNKKGDKNRVDCTGFVKGILKRYADINLKGSGTRSIRRSAYKLGGVKIGTGRKALRKAKPGDLIIYKPERGYPQHFGFYYGKIKGKHRQIDSSPGGRGVRVRSITRSRITVIRLEKAIAKKSDMYEDTVEDILD